MQHAPPALRAGDDRQARDKTKVAAEIVSFVTYASMVAVAAIALLG